MTEPLRFALLRNGLLTLACLVALEVLVQKS